MFWKFNLLTSHIDTLLDKEDVTLHELMDEDDILQECKAQNRKLIDFLIRPENMEELINLITKEPEEDVEEKVRYKYPNTACEVLTSDVSQINDLLSDKESGLLTRVYTFLEADGPLNPLLASFFSKVMGLLITRKSEFMLEFLQDRTDFVGNLLHHIGVSAIMDLLLRLITCIESTETRNAVLSWLNEQNLVQKLIGLIHPDHTSDKHCNAAQSLCDIIRLSREQFGQLQDQSTEDPLLVAIENPENVEKLLSNMFDTERTESVITNGLTVIQTLIEFKRSSPEGMPEQITPLETERLHQGVSNTLSAVMPRFKDFNELLNEPPQQNYSAMPTTAGTLNPPLGNTRLQISRLVACLIQTNTRNMFVELCNLGTIKQLLDLFFNYEWNNFLHTQVECCLSSILRGSQNEAGRITPDSEEPSDNPLLIKLFDEYNIVGRVIEAWEDNDQAQQRPGGHRKGYMGHLTRIANLIVDSVDKGNNADSLKDVFKDCVSEESKEKWETFVAETLAETNKKNTVDLVGSHPFHSSSEDEDADFRDIPFPQDTAMQQAFSDYQLQQMTSNFIDQFGFNEEEFAEQEERIDAPFTDRISNIDFNINANEDNPNAAMFEQACNERIQQFDDPDSDEDVWEDKEVVLSNVSDSRQSSNFSGLNTSRDEDSRGKDSGSNSSDSEEDLQSPPKIYQTPNIDSEKMDIDSNDAWPPLSSVNHTPMDTTPSGLDSPANPFDNSPAQSPTSAENWASFGSPDKNTSDQDSSWANFESIETKSTVQEEKWADFTNFENIGSSELSSTDPCPRSSSPIEMDIADVSRPQAYLVQSAPADLASNIENAKSGGDNSADDAVVKNNQDSVIENTDSTSSESKENEQVGSDVSENLVSTTESSLAKEQTNEQTDSFLKKTGLLKSSDSAEIHGNGPTTEVVGDVKTDQAKLEEIRTQAKETLELYENTTAVSTGASTPNGPV